MDPSEPLHDPIPPEIEGSIPSDLLLWAKDEIYNIIATQSIGPSTFQEVSKITI